MHKTGYCKPPRHTQFVKGRSGNPKGRPKGSQNLATILNKAGRQRVRVTENGRTRNITKFEAANIQLVNKAVSGDLKAIRELNHQVQLLFEKHVAPTEFARGESDEAVMANICERIRNSEEPAQANQRASRSPETEE